MSNETSQQMIGLLKELSVYKAMDQDYAAGTKTEAETEAHNERGRRCRQIKLEMQELATETKSSPS
jgi:hypothetical protein